MKLKVLLPVFVWVLIIILGNYQIISTTNKKMLEYHRVPPFRMGAMFNDKTLIHLLDRREDTEWKRIFSKNGEPDFFLEMKLTHYYDGKTFVPFSINGLEWKACNNETLPRFRAKVFLRESINVDKELRLPEDKLIEQIEFNDRNKSEFYYKFKKMPPFKSEQQYPDGIYIIVLEMTLPSDVSPNDCFSEIKIKE